MARTIVLLPVLLALVSPPAAARGASRFDRIAEDNRLSLDYVTPHVPWGNGYVKGKMRALFLLRGVRGDASWIAAGSRGRPPVELAQRFDIEPHVVYMALNGALHGRDGEDWAVELMKQRFDVFVTTVSLDLLAAKTQYHLLSQVRDGAGLVCFGPTPKEVMIRRREMPRPLPKFLTEPSGLTFCAKWAKRSADSSVARSLLTCYHLGDGRGVRVRAGLDSAHISHAADIPRALAEYELWASYCGRLLLWAAGREADLSFTRVLGEGLVIPRPQLPRKDLTLVLKNPLRKKLEVSVETHLRRTDGWEMALPAAKVELAPGRSASVPVALPVLRAGRYALGAIARSARGVEAFGASAFQVTSELSVHSVTLDEQFVEVGGTVSGTVQLGGHPKPGTRLLLRLRDSYDRVLAEQTLDTTAADEGKVRFSAKTNQWATIFMRAQAVLMDEGGEVAQAETTFNVARRGRGRFQFVSWDYPRTALGYYGALRLRDVAGFTIGLSQTPEHPILEACNMPYIPYTTHIKEARGDDGVMDPVCWSDDVAAEKHVNDIAEKYQPARQRGVFVYSLGDEVSTKGCCLSPACKRAYREYLREQYQTIDALNRSWGAEYQSFDKVDVLTDGDNYEKAALQQGLFARWYDRQAFARYNMVKFCERFHRAFKQRDPFALTGFEGAGRFGDDYDLILRTNGFWTPYPSIGDEVVRSLAPRGYIHGNWTGYSRRAESLIARNWRAITRGYDSIWWWRWDGAGRWRGYVQPDLDLWPATKELTKEMQIVREGLGDLLIRCEMPHAGVAFLYSMPSHFSGNLEKSGDFGKYPDAHATWIYAALDNQIPFRYVTPRLVTEGALNAGEFKVLVLPFTQAIGPAEAKAIRQFVHDGGTLIADLRVGVYDDHCKPQTPGVLDELLGIKRAGRENAKPISGEIDVKLSGQALSLELGDAIADADVQPTEAKPLATLDGVPLILTRKVGKGACLLLNFSLDEKYPKERHLAMSDSTRSFVRSLYVHAGVGPPVAIRRKDSAPLRATEISLFEAGDVELMSLMPVRAEDWTVPLETVVELPAERDVYDLRARKYLGRTREFGASLTVGRATFFALLPWRAEQFTVTLQPTKASRGDVVTAKLTLPNLVGRKGVTAAYVQGFSQDGQALPHLRDVVLLKGGAGAFRFPIPYDQPPAKLTLRATELISGVTREAVCEIVP